MEHEGHRQRLRERFYRAGLDAFAPHEVLELLLTYVIPRKDTKPIAYSLLTRFGSLHGVLQATRDELMLVEGIGESAAAFIAMMTPLFRAYRLSLEQEQPSVTNHVQAVRYCESLLEGERYEKFYVICLDAQMRRLNTALISSGDVTEVRVYARHVVSALTQCSAMGAIITHNHPSGTAMPSFEDIALTNGIYQLLDGIGIKLYDHLVVSPHETFSFRRGGLLSDENGTISEAAQNFEKVLPTIRKEIYNMGRIRRGELAKCDQLEEGDESLWL